VAIAALLVLVLYGCARPQGTVATATIQPSATPVVAAHAPLTIANPVFHSGEVGVTYAPVTLSAAGGVPPYTWTSIGSLPAGLTLSSDGVVSGTPAQNGYFAFGVEVLDFGNNDTAGLPVNIPIVPRLTASLVAGCATECTVELGCASVCGAFGQVSGGAAPITLFSDQRTPAGRHVLERPQPQRDVHGPARTRLQFTVQVTDGFGATALITARYNLIPHISFGGSATCGPIYYRIGCQVKLPYTPGWPNASPQVRVTGASATYCSYNAQRMLICGPTSSPPPGFSATAGGGTVTATVPPGGYTYWTYSGTVTIVLIDPTPCGPGINCSSGAATLTVDLNGG